MMRLVHHLWGTLAHTAVVAVAAGSFVVAGCSSSGGGGSGGDGSSTRAYNGAGSAISLSFTADTSTTGTFHFTHAPDLASAVDGTVNGTYIKYDTGFMKLTVTSSDVGGVAADDTAAALELPGVVVFAAPFATDGNITVLIPTGGCPTSTLSLGWIKSRVKSGWAAATDDVFGEFHYTPGGGGTGSAYVDSKYAINDNPGAIATVGTGLGIIGAAADCSNGKMHITGSGADVDVFLNSAGGALAHDNSASDEIITAMPITTSVTPPDIAGAYAGVSFEDGGNNTPFNVTFTAATPSVGTADVLADITTTAGATLGAATVNLNAGKFSGNLTGTIVTNGGTNTENIACMVLLNAGSSGKKVMSCGSMSDTSKYFSLFMVQK